MRYTQKKKEVSLWHSHVIHCLSCMHADERAGHCDCISSCMDMAKMVGEGRGSQSISYVHNTFQFSPETYNYIKAVCGMEYPHWWLFVGIPAAGQPLVARSLALEGRSTSLIYSRLKSGNVASLHQTIMQLVFLTWAMGLNHWLAGRSSYEVAFV